MLRHRDKMGAFQWSWCEMGESRRWWCEMEIQKKDWDNKKKRKRGNNGDKKSEEEKEEEECVGSAPSLEDDSQLSLSTPVTRNELRLTEWKREKKPAVSLPPPLFCYAVAMATKALSSGLLACTFPARCGRSGIKRCRVFCADFQHTSGLWVWCFVACSPEGKSNLLFLQAMKEKWLWPEPEKRLCKDLYEAYKSGT